MEVISATTAVIGLFAVSNKVTDALWNLDTHPVTETAPIDNALQEVKQYRSTLQVVYKTLRLLEPGKLPFPERAGWIQVDHLVAVLTDTVMAMSEFQILCDMIEDIQDPEDPDTVKLGQYRGKVENLSSRVRWHNLSLTVMMTILKCPGEADAQSSRAGFDKRVTRLLSSNATLSARLSSLRDVFDARGGNPDFPPTYTPTIQPLALPPARNSTLGTLQNTPIIPQPASPHSSTSSTASSTDGIASTTAPRRWSVFTGYTLADLSALSVIPLPLLTGDVRDGAFYSVLFARRMAQELTQLINSSPPSTGTAIANRVPRQKKPKDQKKRKFGPIPIRRAKTTAVAAEDNEVGETPGGMPTSRSTGWGKILNVGKKMSRLKAQAAA